MFIVLGSDWHIGITKDKAIRRVLQEVKANKQQPDVLALLGDFCGGVLGHKSVRSIIKITREYFPDTDIVACLGNHDYWVDPKRLRTIDGGSLHKGYPSVSAFMFNYNQILETFKEFKVHFLDEDGVYRNPNHFGVAIVGHTMWYRNPPQSNDQNFLPTHVEGDTHRWMYKRSMEMALKNLDQLTEEDTTRIFCSHFPLVEIDEYGKEWAGDWVFGESIKEQFKIDKFFNGHAHQFHNGPLRYESGSDYYLPKAMLIEV